MRRWPLFLLLLAPLALAQEAPLGNASPSRLYSVPELLPSLLPLHKEQSSQAKTISLQSSTGAAVFISSVGYLKDNRIILISDFQAKRNVESAISSAMKGSIPKELTIANDRLLYNGTELYLTFSTRGPNGIPIELSDQQQWRKEFQRQLALSLYAPRVEVLNRLGELTIFFGFLLDGAAVSDEGNEERIATLLKVVLSGQDPDKTLSLDDNHRLLIDFNGAKRPIQIIFFGMKNGEPEHLATSDQAQMQIRLIRHLSEVMVRRPQHRAKLSPPAVQDLSPPLPKVDRTLPTQKETTLKEFLNQNRLKPWEDILAFLAKNAPSVHKRLINEVDALKIRLEPIDTFTQPERKFDNTNRNKILVTEIVINTNQTLSLANNSFTTYTPYDQSYLLLYGVLKGIEGISDKGAFDFAAKLRMVLQYNQQKTISPEEMKEDIKNLIFSMLQDEALADLQRWLTEVSVLKKRYEPATQGAPGEAGRAFLQALDESEKVLKELRAKKQRELYEKIFGRD